MLRVYQSSSTVLKM